MPETPSVSIAWTKRWFGAHRLATLPPSGAQGDSSAAFEALARDVAGAPVVLFPDTAVGDLDGFFRLRLTQVLCGEPPLPAVSIVVVTPPDPAAPLAGGFADRFRSGWPFAECVFLTRGPLSAALIASLGLPAATPADDQPPPRLRSEAGADQPIAVQYHLPWERCGSTTAFENQCQDLVRAGFFTIRLLTGGEMRHGPTARARLARQRLIAANTVNAGGHVNAYALASGPPIARLSGDLSTRWASTLAEYASCQPDDHAVRAAAARAEAAIANHMPCLATALTRSPGARLLMDVHDDQAIALRNHARLHHANEAAIQAAQAVVERYQADLLAIPDICTHVSETELARLGPLSRRAELVLPRPYVQLAAAAEPPRFDVLIGGHSHPFNIAAVDWFLNQVWRPFLETMSVRVAIAGGAGARGVGRTPDSPLLDFLGFVDDLDALRAACRLTAVPDRDGTGIAIKTLSTIAAGHPMVSTSNGLRGLPAAVTGLLPMHDDPADFAADILRLLSSQDALDERQALVWRANAAIRRGRGYAAWLAAVEKPVPAAERLQALQTLTADAVPAESEAWHFPLDTPFPMNGDRFDPRVLEEGWHSGEPWGRWTDGDTASLRLTLAAPASDPLALELDLVQLAPDAAVTLHVNGTRLDPVPRAIGTHRWELPPGVTQDQTCFRVSLHVSTLCSHGTQADDRILGFGLSAIRLAAIRRTPFVPGEVIFFESGGESADFWGGGWHGRESWGRWSAEPDASVRMALDDPAADALVLVLVIHPPPTGASLTVTVNGHASPPVQPVHGLNRWLLPDAATRGTRTLSVTLSVSETFCPAEIMDSSDRRTLGIGLAGAGLERAP